MDMDKTELDEICNHLNLAQGYFQNCKIEPLKKGFNRNIYRLTTNDNKKYIVKKGKKTKDSGSSQTNDIISQNFIHHMGHRFTPKIVYYDNNNDLIVETYVGDSKRCNELDNKWLDIFAKQLSIVHNLPVADFYQFCFDHGFDEPQISRPIDHINTYGLERYKIVKKLCDDEFVKNWIEKNLQQNLKEMPNVDKLQSHILWGDIGENIRNDASKLYFIDWEFSRLGYGSELSYIKIHSHLSHKKFDYLVSRYAFYSSKTIKELSDEIKNSEKIIRTNDVIWAAMKWSQAESPDDIEKYKNLTYNRIKLADNT